MTRSLRVTTHLPKGDSPHSSFNSGACPPQSWDFWRPTVQVNSPSFHLPFQRSQTSITVWWLLLRALSVHSPLSFTDMSPIKYFTFQLQGFVCFPKAQANTEHIPLSSWTCTIVYTYMEPLVIFPFHCTKFLSVELCAYLILVNLEQGTLNAYKNYFIYLFIYLYLFHRAFFDAGHFLLNVFDFGRYLFKNLACKLDFFTHRLHLQSEVTVGPYSFLLCILYLC